MQAICDTVESNQDKYTKEESLNDSAKFVCSSHTAQMSNNITNKVYGQTVYVNGYFFACGGLGLERSQDAITWNPVNVGNTRCDCVEYGNGKLLCANNDDVYYTTDLSGSSGWTTATLNGRNTYIGPISLVYGNDVFVLSGDANQQRHVWYSADGVTFNESSVPPANISYAGVMVVYGDGYFYCTCTSNGTSIISRSADGNIWETVCNTEKILLNGICYFNGFLYASDATGVYRLENNTLTKIISGNYKIVSFNNTMLLKDDVASLIATKDMLNFTIINLPDTYDISTSTKIGYNEQYFALAGSAEEYVVRIENFIKPQNPSEALLNMSKNTIDLQTTNINELASMIRSGVESTLV